MSTQLVAVLPSDPLLDTEEQAASGLGLPVVRFRFLDNVEIVSFQRKPAQSTNGASPPPPLLGIFRGFMLTGPRYAKLYRQLLAQQNIRLITSPTEYCTAHYYPNIFSTPALAQFAPRSRWVDVVPDIDSDDEEDEAKLAEKKAERKRLLKNLTPSHFLETANKVVDEWSSSSSSFVMLKDYVKSAKPHFLKISISSPGPTRAEAAAAAQRLAQSCVDLVHHRDTMFNRGVVIKEFTPLRYPRNEWRLWFVGGVCVLEDWNGPDDIDDEMLQSMCVASAMGSGAARTAGMTPVPATIRDSVSQTLAAMQLPFVTVDFAQKDDGGWTLLEMGDGGVSGPAVCTSLRALWECLAAYRPQYCASSSSSSWAVNVHSKVNETWRILQQLESNKK